MKKTVFFPRFAVVDTYVDYDKCHVTCKIIIEVLRVGLIFNLILLKLRTYRIYLRISRPSYKSNWKKMFKNLTKIRNIKFCWRVLNCLKTHKLRF